LLIILRYFAIVNIDSWNGFAKSAKSFLFFCVKAKFFHTLAKMFYQFLLTGRFWPV